MTPEEMRAAADILNVLQQKENDGRGIRCVQAICTYLCREDESSARNVRQLDGDKTRSYPVVEYELYRIFGCRIHGIHDCKTSYCRISQ